MRRQKSWAKPRLKVLVNTDCVERNIFVDSMDKLQESSKQMTKLVLDLVYSVKEHQVSAAAALEVLNKHIAHVYTTLLVEDDKVRMLLQPLLDFFYDARKVIAQVKRNEN
jgi:hypothetical protein